MSSDCILPIKIAVAPDEETILVTGDCPDVVMETFTCKPRTYVLDDSRTYPFMRAFKTYDFSQPPYEEKVAFIFNVKMPEGSKEVCTW